VSARNRSAPWFRAPSTRYELAVAQYEWARQREKPSLFMGGQVVIEQHFYFRSWCEQCGSAGDDVRERIGTRTIHNVIRLRALLCDKCVDLPP
jgi:hypothetical protein